MKKIENIFISITLVSAIAIAAGVFWSAGKSGLNNNFGGVYNTKYGDFLAAQHAIFTNDFDRAAEFANALAETEFAPVQDTRMISEFLSGRIPADAALMKKEQGLQHRLIYDAWLVTNGEWKQLHERHKKDTSALSAPLRIWSAIANDYRTDTFKFIDTLPTNASWKSFVRGQVWAELGDAQKAADEFKNIDISFLNINDYFYLMSFYRAHDMADAADDLRKNFTALPGGMYLESYDNIPPWSAYSGYENALAFSLVQNVSHTQVLMFSDLSILMLRFAQIIGNEYANASDSITYYLGQFFYTNNGNFSRYFEKINKNSPFYPFAVLRTAQRAGDIKTMTRLAREHSLFVPASEYVVANAIRNGKRRTAISVINRAVNTCSSDAGCAYFLKMRASVNYMFGDLARAQMDLRDANGLIGMDSDIFSLQAKIWAAQNKEIDTAYDYAMALVRKNPSDVAAWDTLGRVIQVREGTDAALDLLERVGDVATSNSALFEQLGDLYFKKGNRDAARASYLRAIDFSDDGLVVVPFIERKLRKIK